MAKRFSMQVVPATLAATCLIAAGCLGSIGEPSGGGNGSGSNGGGSNGSGPGNTGPLSQPVASLHKLTIAEFTNSLHDLLGSNAPVSSQLEPDQQLDGFRAVSASVVAVSPMGVSQYESAINAATQFAFSTATQAATVLSCVPASATDATCPVSRVLGAFGRPGRMPGTIDSVHALACPDENTVYLANLYGSRLDKWVAQ